MNYEIVYPNGKTKALTFSYDDGQIFDRRLVEIFDRYKLKATFHLNSGTLDREGFVTKNEIASLYQNHEIACHGVNHLYLKHLAKEELICEVWEDRRNLEKLLHKPVTGFSYAFGEYNEQIVDSLKHLGIRYARTVEATGRYEIPDDFLKWKPTCHHDDDLYKKAEDFLDSPAYRKLSLFYIWGHSFEFERNQNWGEIEKVCKLLAFREDIWYTTNIEYYQYVQAFKNLIYNVEGNCVYNPTCVIVWLKAAGEMLKLEPGKAVNLDK